METREVPSNQTSSYVKRKIYFYKISVGRTTANVSLPYDAKSVLEHINNLSFENHDRYLRDEDGVDISCWIDELSSPQKASFGKIKRSDFPRVEYRGTRSGLSIAADHGLAEFVHVMFFPENIIGLEYNYDGPRISSISRYLYEKSRSVCPNWPEFQQLVHGDTITRLEHLGGVRSFKLKVHRADIDFIKQRARSIGDALEASLAIGEPSEIEIYLSAGRKGGKWSTIGRHVIEAAKALVTSEDSRNNIISSEIRGWNETTKQLEVIDLLSDKFIVEKNIPKILSGDDEENSKKVYEAIADAYAQLNDVHDLDNAPGVTLWPS